MDRLAVFARDVSELRSAREALAEAQRSAHQLVDALPAGLRIFRHEEPELFVLEYENAGAERIHGVAFEEARGKAFRELFPEAYADGATELYAQVWRTGESAERVWTEYDEEGELAYAAHTHVFRLDRERIGVAFNPVTDRMRAEEARLEIEARYRALVESIPAVTYTAALDERSTTTYISPQVEGMLGYSPEDYAADPDLWRQLLHPEDAERVMAAVRNSHESCEHFTCEYRVRSKKGHWVWVRDEGTVVCDAEGRPDMLQGVMTDISERRAAEAELMLHREGLRRLNSELSRVEEAQRRRIAEGLHDHVGQLLVSAKMRLKAALSRREATSEEDDLATIAHLVDEAAAATQDLTFDLSPPILHQLGLIPALEWLSEHLAETRDLAVHVQAADGSLDLPEDVAILLFRSVSELLNNVAKHADVRSARVAIDVEDGEATVVVSDQGSGFEPQDAENTVRRAPGFGLFSVRERLHAVGGGVEIESGPGEGTRVALRVPVGGA